MEDITAEIRKTLADEINAKKAARDVLEKEHGQVWDTEQLRADFEVKGFMAPFVVVKRKKDNVLGSLCFSHEPRFYFGFVTD